MSFRPDFSDSDDSIGNLSDDGDYYNFQVNTFVSTII